jgi:hypothetical protein
MIGPLEDNLVRIDLGLGPAKEFNTAGANLSWVGCHIGIRFQERSEFGWQFAQDDPLIINSSTDVAAQD